MAKKRAHFAVEVQCIGRGTNHQPSIHAVQRQVPLSLSLSPVSLSLLGHGRSICRKIEREKGRREGGKEGRTANIQQRQQRQRWLQKHKNARDYAGVGGGDGGDGTSEGEHHLASQVVDFTLPSVVSRSVGCLGVRSLIS